VTELLKKNIETLLMTDVAMAPLEAYLSGQITLRDALSSRKISEYLADQILA